MKRIRRAAMVGVLASIVTALVVLVPGTATSEADGPENKILARELAVVRGEAKPAKHELPLSAGVVRALVDQYGGDASVARAPAPSSRVRPPSSLGSQGCQNVFSGRIDNVRVNQDCSLRRQAEEVVVVNPTRFNNLIAGQNDSRIGFNHCGYDWSLDRGRTWGDTGTAPPPFWQELLDDGHTSDACSDPSATFDHRGNAYITGVFFDIISPASAILVAKSNDGIDGRFYHTPFPVPFQEYLTTPMGRPASDNDPDIFHDKEFMIADSRPTSPKKGRVYVVWTRFETTNFPEEEAGRSPILFSQSLDGGATWSEPVIISGSSGSFCTVFGGTPDNPNACDQDQGAHPVVGPDGTIYVVFGNANTPELGVNQVLVVKCPATNECDNSSDWQGPFRVGDLIGTHPIGDPGNVGGCPVGRQCLPPNGYRVPEFTSMSISVDSSSRLNVVWSDYRNGRSPCTPLSLWSEARPPCDNDVFYAFSNTGGESWSQTINLTPRSELGETAQWQPWHDVSGDGSVVFAAFYDRQYGNCEFSGCNDITLAAIIRPRSPERQIVYLRITTSSMPNLVPANNPVQAGFLGDYMWVEVSRHDFAQEDVHIVWADTRPLFGDAPEEDVYYARIPLSNLNLPRQ